MRLTDKDAKEMNDELVEGAPFTPPALVEAVRTVLSDAFGKEKPQPKSKPALQYEYEHRHPKWYWYTYDEYTNWPGYGVGPAVTPARRKVINALNQIHDLEHMTPAQRRRWEQEPPEHRQVEQKQAERTVIDSFI